jgi:hypothetical protein
MAEHDVFHEKLALFLSPQLFCQFGEEASFYNLYKGTAILINRKGDKRHG